MRLRVIALAVWPLAVLFTVFVSPVIDTSPIKALVAEHASQTVTAVVISESKQVVGFNGSSQSQVEIRIKSPSSLAGKQGLLQNSKEEFQAGDEITGVITFRPSHRNDFAFKASLKHLSSVRKGTETDFFAEVRSAFSKNIRGVSSDASALVAGLAIGDDSKLSSKTKDDFKTVSLTHLTAVSGANCAIVLAAVALLLLRLPIPRRLRILFSVGAIGGYLALVGPEPSVLRASVMVGAVLVGQFFGRKILALDAISLSVIVLLLIEPWLSVDYGFALSVLATLGLLVLSPKLVEVFSRRIPKWLAVLLSVTVAAQVACLPVLLMLQPDLPVYSVFANLLAEPMVVPITVIGLIACLVAPVLPAVAGSLSYLASIPASWIVFVASTFAKQPLASISWFNGAIGIVLAVLVTMSIALLLIHRSRKIKGFAGVVLLLVGFSFFSQNASIALTKSAFYSGKYTLVNCDVGQGDALVIQSGGQVAVVDVGREDPAIDKCLEGLGINRIDLLVLTHFDMDHIGGVMGAITGREVSLALITSFKDTRPGADFAQQMLQARGIEMVQAEKGMSGNVGDFSWQVLSPHRGAPEAEDSNDGSISMFWEDKHLALFTLADLGERGQLRIGEEQQSFLTSGFGGKPVVVKVAHHGSADQAAEFYEAIKPDLALISVGARNSYGHPTMRTLGVLNSLGSKILRTDQQGAIGISETEAGLTASVSGRS